MTYKSAYSGIKVKKVPILPTPLRGALCSRHVPLPGVGASMRATLLE